VAASPDATDTGDFLTLADCTTANSTFFGMCPSGNTIQQNSSWHGTHVAGTIAAIGNNSAGVIGGAYGARILPVRALGKGGGYMSDVSDAIMWAAGLTVAGVPVNPNPAKVINLSLGATSSTCPSTQQAAITAAVNAGVVVVVAAGNETQDVANASPANCQNVISVAAVARDGSRAWYSNFSSPASKLINQVSVTLAAQGGDKSYLPAFDPGILSTINAASQVVDTTPAGGTYQYDQGTSMATPHVSAAVALMLSYNPALTPARVKQILSTPAALTTFPTFSSASGMGSYDCAANHNCGTGILNANLALQNSTTTAPPPPSGGGGGGCSIMPFDANPDVSLLLAMLAVGVYWLRRRVINTRGEA
jgi:serine protease